VVLVLAEKEIPFKLVAVDLAAKEQKTPEFLAMHPFGQVPVIVSFAFQVHFSVVAMTDHFGAGRRRLESRAICRYLAEKYAEQGTPLYPKGLKKRALVEQAASVESANFQPAILKVGMEAMGKLCVPPGFPPGSHGMINPGAAVSPSTRPYSQRQRPSCPRNWLCTRSSSTNTSSWRGM
jgi:hypothetical protein